MKEAAIPAHETPTNTEDPWDGPKAVAAAPEDAAVLRYMHAWVDADGNPDSKASYKFPHHAPEQGSPANIAGVNNAMARLGQADIPEADRADVEAHLKAHQDDAEKAAAAQEADVKAKEDAEKLAKLQDMLDAAADLAAEIADEYAPPGDKPPADKPPADKKPPAGDGEKPPPGMFGSEAGGTSRRGRRRGSAADAASFDPHNRSHVEALASAMVADARFAAQVAKVAEGLRGAPIDGEFVSLSESAVRPDGTAYIKLIQPGWGSSGYYSPELLERDGAKTFPKGTKMYWNHQTEAEEQARPEGDLRDLAGETLEDARWMAEGPQGAGLYASSKVFSDYQERVNELAPHIGVSIRAYGKASEGSAEGRDGTIIDSLTWGQSVDYVTEPGAGGRVLELFEAAGRRTSKEGQMSDAESKELKEARQDIASRNAKDIVSKALGESELPEPTQKRLVESLTASVKLDEAGKLDEKDLAEQVTEAVKAEAAYLAELGAGRVQGLGPVSQDPADPKEATEALAANLVSLGMSESAAKAAAAAR